ncbi:MAG: flagellar motor protein MotB [Betaproteobacteria bacterium]|nr:flagellar motor protein MotB [Betaproteobacteria bacterium]
MSDNSQRPIIIKRVKRTGHGGHNAAWKIAYADFVTAMMAFFLLMWLLGSTTKADLQGIAQYFRNPLKVSMSGGSGSGDSSSVIKGGGQDLTRSVGQVKQGATPERRSPASLKAAEAALAANERARLRELKLRIERAIEASPTLAQYRGQMLLDLTSEGLRVQIVDKQNRPMFANGSAQLRPYARAILDAIAGMLNGVPNRISIAGHTDATPYSGGEEGYSNWELSADRANAARRELLRGGLQENRVVRVVGLASAVPLDAANPIDPLNRRISIIVLNKRAEEAIRKEAPADDPGAHAPADTRPDHDEAAGGARGAGPEGSAPGGPAARSAFAVPVKP